MQLSVTKTKRQQLADREIPVSQMLPISHLNSPTVFETKQGAQGCVIRVQGCPFEVADADGLRWNQRLIANLLLTLSDEFALYVATYRRKHAVYPKGHFP